MYLSYEVLVSICTATRQGLQGWLLMPGFCNHYLYIYNATLLVAASTQHTLRHFSGPLHTYTDTCSQVQIGRSGRSTTGRQSWLATHGGLGLSFGQGLMVNLLRGRRRGQQPMLSNLHMLHDEGAARANQQSTVPIGRLRHYRKVLNVTIGGTS